MYSILSAAMFSLLIGCRSEGPNEDLGHGHPRAGLDLQGGHTDSIQFTIESTRDLYQPTGLPLFASGKDTVINVVIPQNGLHWVDYGGGSMAFEVSRDTVYVSLGRDTINLRGPLVIASTQGGRSGVMVYDPESPQDTFSYRYTARTDRHAVRAGSWNIWKALAGQEVYYDYVRGDSASQASRR